MKATAVLFDLDGVIVDSLRELRAALVSTRWLEAG
jgi:beta-phosphoglucomutase-like phosphatase (HAD superfamily)